MATYEKAVRDIMSTNKLTFVRPGKGDHHNCYSPITQRHIPEESNIKSR